MRNLPAGEYFHLNGGRDDKSDAIELPGTKFQLLRNMITDRDSVEKRKGYSAEYATGLNSNGNIQRVHFYEDNSQVQKAIIVVDGKIYRSDLDGTAPTDITGTVTVASGADALISMVTYDGRVIGTDGVNPLWYINSVTADAAVIEQAGQFTLPITCGVLGVYYGYLIAGDVTEREDNTRYPYRFRWTTPPAINAWDHDRFVDLDRNQKIVSLPVHGRHMVILQERSTWVATLDQQGSSLIESEFRFDNLDTNVGAVSDKAVVQTERGLFWIDRKGFYHMAPGDILPPEYIGKPNESTWALLNRSRLKYSCGGDMRERNGVLFVVPLGASQPTNNLGFFLNYEEWGRYGSYRHPAFSTFDGSDSEPFLFNCLEPVLISGRDRLWGGKYDGKVYLMDEGTLDIAEGFEAQFRTPYYAPAGRSREAVWYQLALDVDLETKKTITIIYRLFNDLVPVTNTVSAGTNAGVLGSFIIGTDRLANDDLGRLAADLSGRSRYIELDVNIGSDQEVFRLHGIILYHKPVGRHA